MTNTNALFLGIAMLVSTAFGFCITSLLLPVGLSWLRLALAPGVGAGLSAFLYFLFRRPMLTVEYVLLAAAILLLWRRRRTAFAGFAIPDRSRALLLILPAVTLTLAAFVLRVYRMPHGNWDGWAIWNWEARILYRAGAAWKDFLPYAFHGDYPLLVPSVTARFWRYAGIEIPEAGAWLGIVLALCSVAVLALTLAKLRNAMLGTLMGLALIGTPSYLDYATSQYADIPIGFFFIGCLALIAIYFEHENEPHQAGILALAGFLAGCAGWTKNEGILFIIAGSLALLLPILREQSQTLRRFAAFFAGAAAPLAIIVFFKLTNNVGNYVVAYQQGKLQRAFDLSRHEMILGYIGKYIFSFGVWSFSPFVPLIALILFTGIRWSVFASKGWLTPVFILIALSGGYYFVYLTTPLDLKTHIVTSLDRLLLQLWPSVLLMSGLICQASPEV